jgi:regulatory protein
VKITTINSDDTASRQITSITPQVKNQNRVNIFVDGKYSFSLDITQLVDFKLKVGQQLGQSEIDNLKRASESGKLYQRTLEWALTRPRSVKETRDYLYRKQAAPEDSDNIIAKLTAKNYLNDENFARIWVENRYTSRGISRRRLELELRKKGISAQIIEQVFAETSRHDSTEIVKIIHKKRNKYDDQQLIQYLVRQGFDYESAKTAVLETDSQSSA